MEFVLLCNSLIKQKIRDEPNSTPRDEVCGSQEKNLSTAEKIAIACGFKLYCKRYLDFQQLKTEAFNRRWAKTETELENKNGNVQFVCRMDALLHNCASKCNEGLPM